MRAKLKYLRICDVEVAKSTYVLNHHTFVNEYEKPTLKKAKVAYGKIRHFDLHFLKEILSYHRRMARNIVVMKH